MEKKDTKYIRTHKKLLDLGMQQMREKGFDGISIKELCKLAGISRATYYLHFDSKEQILAEFFEKFYFMTDEMKAWIYKSENSWLALVRIELCWIHSTCRIEYLELISRYISYQITGKCGKLAFELNDEMKDLLVSYVRNAQRNHLFENDSDPFYLSNAIFMLTQGNMFKWCANQGNMDCFKEFFWNLEAVLCVKEEYRGLWKMEELYMSLLEEKRD
jgi:AcrR family transcriptional regulator